MDYWKPFESHVMDNEFVLIDARTRESPSAFLIDAIGPRKYEKPGLKSAHSSIRMAINSLRLAEECPAIHCPYATLNCLFAIWSLKKESPVVALNESTCDSSAALEALQAAAKCQDEAGAMLNVVRALMSLAAIFPRENFVESLKQVRGWAWSSYITGIVMHIDAEPPPVVQRSLLEESA